MNHYDKNKVNQLIQLINDYWNNNNFNKSTPLADIVIPEFIENSTKNMILNHKDRYIASKLWKQNASLSILKSNITKKYDALNILEDEIKFQNYLWNKKWKEYDDN